MLSLLLACTLLDPKAGPDSGASAGDGGPTDPLDGGGGGGIDTGGGGADGGGATSGTDGGDDGGDDGGTDDGGATVPVEPALVSDLPPGTDDVFLDPERGMMDWVDLLSPGHLHELREDGYTLAWSVISLEEWADTSLPASLLDQLQDGLDEAREAGIKVVLRFNYTGDTLDDAPLSIIQTHIDQLAPLLRDNADIIATVQAGFIGAWGEWHSSTNGNDTTEARSAVVEGLLAALPASRTVQVRTPDFKAELYGGPLTEDDAFSGSEQSRVGQHNDCFLASHNDYGTYDWADPEPDRAFAAEEARFLPMGGETCRLNPPRTDCESALEEMETLHWRYLNSRYHPDVLMHWDTEGCLEEMRRRLGHRLVLAESWRSEAVAPGGRLRLRLAFENEGFGAPYNPRPVRVVLDRGGEAHQVELTGLDPRRFEPGERHEVEAELQLPATLAEGDWRLSLWLPDPDLEGDPRYALRLALDAAWWDEDAGMNVLTRGLRIGAEAGGAVDPEARELSLRSIELR